MFSRKKITDKKPVVSKPNIAIRRRFGRVALGGLKRPRLARPKRGQLRYGLAALVLVLACGLAGFGGAALYDNGSETDLSAKFGSQKKIVTSESKLISQIAKTVGPGVVSVDVSISTGSSDSLGLFGGQQSGTEQAAGTGVILSKSGIIMTNRHVVPSGTDKVGVTLSDGTELDDVSVIGRTNDNDSLDIAFLKVNNTEGHDLMPATIGDSGSVQVGDNVIAIGNALGQFQNTVTSGIISGFGRSVQAGDSDDQSGDYENLDDLFQTDAAINQGNSGGPLVNLNGQVIGINTAIAGDGAQNIGFSIPINNVNGLIKQVLKTGKFARPYLGIRYLPLNADLAKGYDLDVEQGAFIAPAGESQTSSVIEDGPAAKAGLQERDVITAIDGKKN